MLTATLRLPALRLPARLQGLSHDHLAGTGLLVLMIVLYLAMGFSIAGRDGANAKVTRDLTAAAQATPPAPEPLQFKKVAPQDALAINSAVPLSDLPNPAATPFLLNAASEQDRIRSLQCLTAAVYYEAATESVEGQRAVAQVVLNRVRHPAYPSSVCGVVFQGSERATGCQFTFTCDGSIARTPSASHWARARAVAEAALAGSVYAPVGWATHYHTNWVVPYWSSSLTKLANVGTHIFYRWEGGWGRAPAFTDRHAGREPLVAKMRYLGFSDAPPLVEEAEAQALAAAAIEAPLSEEALKADTIDADMMKRTIIRRFEPVTREGVAATLAKQTAPGTKVDESHRWALTGGAPSGEAFGKKPAAVPAKPVAAAVPVAQAEPAAAGPTAGQP